MYKNYFPVINGIKIKRYDLKSSFASGLAAGFQFIEDIYEHFNKVIDGSDFSAIYVVGDLHGCYSLLMQELEKVHFNFEKDLLICTGDLVDRGNENLECVSLVSQPWFYCVRGNHEEMCIKSRDDAWIQDIHAQNGGEWFYLLSTENRMNSVKFFGTSFGH